MIKSLEFVEIKCIELVRKTLDISLESINLCLYSFSCCGLELSLIVKL